MDAKVIAIKLPKVNGDFHAGIALATEQSIDKKEKLRVYTVHNSKKDADGKVEDPLPSEDSIKYTLIGLVEQLNDEKVAELPKRMLVSGAAILLMTGNIALDDKDKPDGDWVEVELDEFKKEWATDANIKFVDECLQHQELQKAATVVVGTKINWFKENHHTGQGGRDSGSFSRKVLKSMYGEDNVESLLLYAHRLGHWASTKSILTQLGLQYVARVYPLIAMSAKLAPTDDIRIRLRSAPAGTARLAVSFVLAQKMFKHPMAILCPEFENYSALPSVYERITASPARYHFGAEYLCGARANYHDMDYDSYIGRAGAWGSVFIPNNTIMKSPHAKAYENAADYDPDFRSQCQAFKAERAKQLKEKLKLFKEVSLRTSGGYSAVCRAFNVAENKDAEQVLALLRKAEEEEMKKTF